MINSRKINDLQPYVASLCNKLIQECMKQRIDLLITSTLRDQQYQSYLYSQGRTRPGAKVTNSKYIGAHGYGLAFDVVPVKSGKAIWNDNTLWNEIGAIGKGIGLEWGGDWKTISDKPHFQYTQGLSSAQLRAGKRPKFSQQTKTVQEGIDIMSYKLEPICKGKMKDTTIKCYEKPSNASNINGTLKKGIHEPIRIYVKVKSEGSYWCLINAKTEQWIPDDFIQVI